MRKSFVLFLPLFLTGCMSSEEQMAANSAQDDRACLSYGAKPGSDAYVACRAQLEGSRRQADAAEDGARSAVREEMRRQTRRQN